MDFYDNPRELTAEDLDRMLIPEEFRSTELADIRDAGLRTLVGNYIKNMRSVFAQRVGLFVWGPAASGKGAVASVIAKEARRRYKPGMYIAIWELRESLVNKVMFSSNKTPMERAREVDLLVLDGLDDEDLTEKLLSLTDIARLIISRAQRHKLTILTSRLSHRDLSQTSKGDKFWESIKKYMVPVEAPAPGDEQEAREEQMRRLLLGDDA